MKLHHHHRALQASEGSPLLRSLDPRVKLLGALCCVIAISLVPIVQAPWVSLFSLCFLFLARLCGLGAARALWRASVVLPFVLLPVLLKRSSLPWDAALHHAALLGLKSWMSALVLVVLVSTTPLVDLCAAAERLWAPRALTQTILFTERYLRLLQRRFTAMLTAARLRGFVLRRRREQVLGAMAGSLLLRTMDRADRVYSAMKARGYQGSIPRLTPLRFHGRDAIASLLVLGWSVGLWWLTCS